MSDVVGFRSWPRAHPLAADALSAAVMFGVALVPYTDKHVYARGGGLSPFLLGVLIACCCCLVLRRRRPWGVWVATTAIGLVGVIASGGTTPTYMPALLAF